MAPQSWATPEEQVFLKARLPEYEACQVKRKYKNFWQQLYGAYFEKFPVSERLFPGLEVSQLSQEQKDSVASVITRQKKVSQRVRIQSGILNLSPASQGMVSMADEPSQSQCGVHHQQEGSP